MISLESRKRWRRRLLCHVDPLGHALRSRSPTDRKTGMILVEVLPLPCDAVKQEDALHQRIILRVFGCCWIQQYPRLKVCCSRFLERSTLKNAKIRFDSTGCGFNASKTDGRSICYRLKGLYTVYHRRSRNRKKTNLGESISPFLDGNGGLVHLFTVTCPVASPPSVSIGDRLILRFRWIR